MSSASHNQLVPTAPRTRGNKLQIPLTSRVVAPRRESREDGSGDIRERWPKDPPSNERWRANPDEVPAWIDECELTHPVVGIDRDL